MIGSIAHTTLCLCVINIGFGRHFWDIRAISLTEAKIRQLSAVDIVYGVVIFFVKMSLLFLYYRLFSVYASSRKLIYGGIFMCTLITLPYIGIAISRVVVCSSFKINLEHLTYCYTKPVNTAVLVFGVANVINDFYILAIPMLRVKSLHVESRAKIGLVAIFLVGLAACLMSIARVIYVAVNFSNNSDPFYRGAQTSIFTYVAASPAAPHYLRFLVPSNSTSPSSAAVPLPSPPFTAAARKSCRRFYAPLAGAAAPEPVPPRSRTRSRTSSPTSNSMRMECWMTALPKRALLSQLCDRSEPQTVKRVARAARAQRSHRKSRP
jgi:hypothetical protein